MKTCKAEAMDDGPQIGYKVLPRGTPVVTADGEQIGTVQRVLDNAREHIFDGIIITTRDGRRFVDAPEVARITEKRVSLTIDSAAARNLPEHRGALGALEKGAKRRLLRWQRRLGR
jgi:PRC-barrel domain protein